MPPPAELGNVAENRPNDDGEEVEGIASPFISSPKSPIHAIDVNIDDERGDEQKSPIKAEIIDIDDEHVESGDLQEELKAAFKEGEAERQGFTKDLGNKILGVGYNYEEDSLYVRVREKLFKPVETKRQLLSWISSI